MFEFSTCFSDCLQPCELAQLLVWLQIFHHVHSAKYVLLISRVEWKCCCKVCLESCLCMHVGVCSMLANSPLPRPWEWGQSDRADSLFPNTSVWPAASHTFHYIQTDFQEQESKGIGVVKTWHSLKRAAGPWDYPETSYMTPHYRNYNIVRVANEGPLTDLVPPKKFSIFLSLFLSSCIFSLIFSKILDTL